MRAGFYSQSYAKCRSYLTFTRWMTEWIYIQYFLHSALYIKDKAQTKKTSRSSQDEIGPLTKRSPITTKVALTYIHYQLLENCYRPPRAQLGTLWWGQGGLEAQEEGDAYMYTHTHTHTHTLTNTTLESNYHPIKLKTKQMKSEKSFPKSL